jgi:hypothetical protein
MKNLLILILGMLIHGTLNAQTLAYHKPQNERHAYANIQHDRDINNFPDSIRIEMPDQNIIVVAEAKNFSQGVEAIKKMHAQLEDLSKYIVDNYPKNEKGSYRASVSFDQNGFKNIAVETRNNLQTQILIKNDQLLQLLPPGWEIFIQEKTYKIYVYAEKIENLKNIVSSDFEMVQTKLNESKSFITGRRSVKARFILRENNIEYQSIQYAQPLDMISLSASTGLGVYQNKLYPELTGALGLYFADRFNRASHRVELSFSSMYFAASNSEGYTSSAISSFLTLSYSKNFAQGDKKTSWLGVGGGLLVNEIQDFFKGKTAKLFLIKDFGNNFSLLPEFYLTDDFKKMQYGLKLHYRF